MLNIDNEISLTMPTLSGVQSDNKQTTNIDSSTETMSAIGNSKLVNAALQCLVPEINGRTVFSDIECRMTGLAQTLEELGIDNLNKSSSQDRVQAEMQKISVARREVAVSPVNIAATAKKLSSMADAIDDLVDAIREDSRKQDLNTRYSQNQVQAKLSQLKESSNDSYMEMWNHIATGIDHLKTNYVDKYAKLMKLYTDMYDKFNSIVQKAAAQAVKAGKDGNTINFNAKKIKASYDNFFDERQTLEKKLGNIQGWDKMDANARERAGITFAPAFKISDDGRISFNTEQYSNMPDYPSGVSSGDTDVSVPTTVYQAWLASLNAAGSAFQSNMQAFAQRYSQANNTFDNLNKILSNTISSLAEVAKEAFRSLT